MKQFQLLSVLLDYPQDALWQHGEELRTAAAELGLPSKQRTALQQFVEALLAEEPLTAQDRWLSTFDRGRAMSLLLFEHIHGESRDRGQAMVDLLQTYQKNGFELATKELPDYLPLVLEYLSQRSTDEACEWLGSISHIVGLLAARAAERQSPYAVIFELLIDSANGKVDLSALRRTVREETRDDTPAMMDKLWEEEAVRFGTEPPQHNNAASGCGNSSQFSEVRS